MLPDSLMHPRGLGLWQPPASSHAASPELETLPAGTDRGSRPFRISGFEVWPPAPSGRHRPHLQPWGSLEMCPRCGNLQRQQCSQGGKTLGRTSPPSLGMAIYAQPPAFSLLPFSSPTPLLSCVLSP